MEYYTIPKDGGTVSYLPIAKIDVLRITCPACGVAFEMSLQKVERAMGAPTATDTCCPICKHKFTNHAVEDGANIIAAFAKAMLSLRALAIKEVIVELPVTIK